MQAPHTPRPESRVRTLALSPLALLGLLALLQAGCKGSKTTQVTGTLEASSVDFGSLAVGDSSSQTVVISAVGAGVNNISLQITGPNMGEFQLNALNFPMSLDPNATANASVIVTFTPADSGPRTANLVLSFDPTASGGGGGSVLVPVTGIGVAISDIKLQVNPLTLDFGPVQIGQYSTLPLTVHNLNSLAVSVVLTLGDGGVDGGEYYVPQPGPHLDANHTENVSVSFIPTELGPSTSTLQVAACKGCPPQAVALSGTGVDATIQFSPAEVDFGFVLDGVEAPPIHVVASVVGNVPVKVLMPTAPSGNIFGVANGVLPAASTLSPDGGFVSFDVTYSPSHFPGGDLDHIDLPYAFVGSGCMPGGLGCPVARLTVTGNHDLKGGCRLDIVPQGSLDFGTLAPGQQVSRSLDVINVGGADCDVTAIKLAAGSDPGFALGSPDGKGGVIPLASSLVVPAHSELGQNGLPVTFSAPHDSPRYSRAGKLTFASTDPTHPAVTTALTAHLSSAYDALSPWPKWRHDSANTGQGEVDTSHFDGGLLWKFSLADTATTALPFCATGTGGYYVNGPIIGADRTVYATGCDGTFYAIDELGGSVTWKKALQAPGPGSYTTPALAPDDVLDLAYGTETGPNTTPDLPFDAGVVLASDFNALANCGGDTNGFVAAPLFDLYQLAANNASLVSVQNQVPCSSGGYPFTPVPGSTPALSIQGNLYVSFVQPTVVQIPGGLQRFLAASIFPPQAAVGDFSELAVVEPLSVMPSLQTVSPAVADDGSSYWCSENSCLALSIDGTVLWNVQLPGGAYLGDYSAPVLGNGEVYLLASSETGTDFGGTVSALDRGSGAVTWSYALPVIAMPDAGLATDVVPAGGTLPFFASYWGVTATPALTPENLLIVPYWDGIYAVNATPGATQGTLAWKLPVPGGTTSSPALGSDGTIFVGTVSQGLLAIDPTTHTTRWSFVPRDSDGGVVSISGAPAVGQFGVFFAADDGLLYGVH